MLRELIEMLSYPFVHRALIVGMLICVCAAALGVVLVLKQYSMIGHALSDVGFASLSLAAALGLAPLAVSIPMVVAASFAVMAISQSKKVSGDIAIGMVATGSLAVGVMITAFSRGFNMDVYDYLFGSILAVQNSDVWLSLGLSVVVAGLFAALYNRIFFVTYDEDYAQAMGIPVRFYQFLIAFLTALTVVIGMRMMGTMLISSFIIFPAITARGIVKSFKSLIALSIIIATACFFAGMLASLLLDTPPGASVVFINVLLWAASLLVRKISRRRA